MLPPLAQHQADPGIAKAKGSCTLRIPESRIPHPEPGFFFLAAKCTSTASQISLPETPAGASSFPRLLTCVSEAPMSPSRRLAVSSPSGHKTYRSSRYYPTGRDETASTFPQKRLLSLFFRLQPNEFIYLYTACLLALMKAKGEQLRPGEISTAWLRFSSDVERSMKGR